MVSLVVVVVVAVARRSFLIKLTSSEWFERIAGGEITRLAREHSEIVSLTPLSSLAASQITTEQKQLLKVQNTYASSSNTVLQ